MLLRKIEAETLCDNGCCGKTADFAIEREGTPFCMELHLCAQCINDLNYVFNDYLNNTETARKGVKKCGNK